MIDKLIEQQETIKGMQENEDNAIKIMKMYEDYKLRVDKAIEYIEDDRLYMSNGNVLSIANTGCGKKILEILKGEDK